VQRQNVFSEEGAVVFAPLVAKPKAKPAEPQRSAIAAQRPGCTTPAQAQLLQRTIGNQALTRLLTQRAAAASNAPGPIQPKLKVGAVNDPLEHEADRVADQVMRMPAPEISAAARPPQVSRKCAECEGEDKLQRKSTGPQAATGEAPASVHEVLRSPGQSLDAATRGFFEPRFGRDFSEVRVHADAPAAASSRDVNANAYTVGHDIVFGLGRFTPGTHEGRRLIAHELAHVTQQEAAGSEVRYGLFRQEDEGNHQPPPPTTVAPPPTTAATPCVPKFKSLTAKITSRVGVREFEGKCAIMLGTPGRAHGTTFTSKVDVPTGCTGTLQYVQLIDMCRVSHLTTNKNLRRKTGEYYIDTQDPIDQQQVSSAGAVEFKGNDSPFQPIARIMDRVRVQDRFKLWLMWKPDQPADAPRIPLAMTTWSWSVGAKVKRPDEDCVERWTVTNPKPKGGIGKATKESPAATKTVTSQDPPTEEGTC
jgi:hypothetical protein